VMRVTQMVWLQMYHQLQQGAEGSR
jgi:hypothetical protein